MWPLGHMGIGSKLVSPMSKGLPRKPLLLGCLLPDLIDKPLYYGFSIATGLRGSEIGLVSGTRTFGHTALSLVVLSLVTLWRRSTWLAALTLGAASHILLDNLDSALFNPDPVARYRGTMGLLWPFLGNRFPDYPFRDWAGHLGNVHRHEIWIAELIGATLLLLDWWRLKHPQPARKHAR